MKTINDTTKYFRLCINLEISKGWMTMIALNTYASIFPIQHVLVDYTNRLSDAKPTIPCYIG